MAIKATEIFFETHLAIATFCCTLIIHTADSFNLTINNL